MNLTELIDRVQRAFGDTSEAQITRADIQNWANQGLVDIVRKTHCLEKKFTDSAVSGGEVVLPSDFLLSKLVLWNDEVINEISFDEVSLYSRHQEGKLPQGTPNKYYIFGGSLHLYPKPSTTGEIDLYYIYRPAVVSEAGVIALPIPEAFHEDLIRYCLARAKELDDDLESAAFYQIDYENRVGLSRSQTNHPHDSFPVVREDYNDWA